MTRDAPNSAIHAPVVRLIVNGEDREIAGHPGRRLSEVLRSDLGLVGTKVGCDAGDCGACTVLLDGAAVCACLTPVAQAQGRLVETVESLAGARPSLLQQAFLRHGAAQCGICTPGMLMAAQSLLRQGSEQRNELSRREVEDALSGVLCRCTGYVKIVDAVLDAAGQATINPSDAALDVGFSPLSGTAVGAAVARVDGLPKVLGQEMFGADDTPMEPTQDMLWLRAVRAPYAAARFEFGDLVVWAEAHEVMVFTAADIVGQNRFSVIPAYADQPVLAENHVRMRGEAVALVAGRKTVMDALQLEDFPIQWTPDVALGTIAQAQQADATQLHQDRDGNLLIRGHVKRGDAQTALAGAAHVVERHMSTSHVEHAYIEPEAGSAWMQGDVLNIWACTQAPMMDRDETARLLGLLPERVRIRPAATGGGFGAKLDLSVQPFLGLVTLKTGRPSKMVYSRRESMMATTKRHPAEMYARIGVNADGRLLAMEFDGDFDTGAYSSWGPTVAVRVPVHASGPYQMPEYTARARAVHTNGPVSGAFRGFGVPQAALLQETMFDELAEAAGVDRLAFRRLNALRDGQETVCGQHLQGVGIADCLDALQGRWAAAGAEVVAFNAANTDRKRGIGVASCWYGCGNTGLPNPSTMRIGITADGQLCLHQGAMDIGQGANTVIAQIAADALGVAVSEITLIGADTAVTPDCGKTSASRQTFVTGKAALLAGQALRSKLLGLTNMGPKAVISLEAGCVWLRDGAQSRRITLDERPVDGNGYVLAVEETYDPPTQPLDENGQGAPYAVYGYGAQLAEVEVDLELGTVGVLQITAAHDLGRVINPLLAEGQIEGGIAQGLGMALMEEYIAGHSDNLHDYLIPTVGDMPKITSILIEKPDPEGPFGAKGLGEHVLIPTAPAILNAIRHATGARIDRLPAKPDRVLAAILAAAMAGGGK